MSREPFIQSEDKEFEVTFREVRNWDEYANLDFEADNAPLTDEEAGIVSEPDTEASENAEAWSDNEWNVSNVDSNVADEDVEEAVSEEEPQAETLPVPEAEDVEASVEEQETEDAPEADAEDTEFPTEEEAEAAVEEGTSTEASVVSPVADNFEVEPAWEDEETSENAEEASDEELPLGEPAADTEVVGSSLETALVHTEDEDLAVDDANDVTAFNIDFDNQGETVTVVNPAVFDISEFLSSESDTEESDVKPRTLEQIVAEAIESGAPVLVGDVRDTGTYTVGELNVEEESSLNHDSYALDVDTEVDTFEAVSSDDESLNKAETVEEIPAEYSEDTLPATQPIETGDFLSFELSDDEENESNEEAEDTAKSEATEDKNESEDEDDESYSLELDLSEDEDN